MKERKRLVHPSSFILHPSSFRPKVTDFGLAKQLDEAAGHPTESGAVLGTPSYMAPEQAAGRGQTVGPAADVYALGAILHEALTGRPPFLADTPLETLHRVVSEEPIPPSRLQPRVPRDLDTVCLKCLEKEPRRRYKSACALADDLGCYLRGEPIRARPAGASERLVRWCRRKPVVASLSGALLLALVVGCGGTLYYLWQAEAARREAEASDAQVQQLLNEVLQSSPGSPLETSYSRRLPDIDVLLKAEPHFDGLLRKRPGDTRVRVALTNVRGSLGTLYGLRGQTAEMEASYQGARDLWEALARQGPGEPQHRDWLADTCHWQAGAALRQGQVARWLRLDQQAVGLWQELAEEQPGNLAVRQKLAGVRFSWLDLRITGVGPEAILPALEEERARLGQLLGEAPQDTALRKRLALTYLVLGEYHHGRRATPEALPCWRQAYEHYQKLPEAQPEGPLVPLNLALCCSRLLEGQPSGPYYAEAVARFGQAADRLTALVGQHPGATWLSNLLLESHCALAVCHWKAGRARQGEQTFAGRVRPFAARVSEQRTDPLQGVHWLGSLLRAAGSLREANAGAALALAREAAALAERYADAPSRDLEVCASLAIQSLAISALLCQLGEAEEALRLAEQGRRLCAGLRRAAPQVAEYGQGLSSAWERIAKARWGLGRADEALAAFREAAAVQRQVVAQAPSVRAYRVALGRCYGRLAYWGGLHGDRATVAAALREREKLWPDNANELRKVARDFEELAGAVGQGREQRSGAEQEERRGYLAESERARRAAEKARSVAASEAQR